MKFKVFTNSAICRVAAFFVAMAFSVTLSNAQVSIEDPVFKSLLLQTGIDENNDGEISESEALLLTEFIAINKPIKSLEGIGFFQNLASLSISYSELEWANLSRNGKLENVSFTTNESLKGIDLPFFGKIKNLRVDECPNISSLSPEYLPHLLELSFVSCTGIKSIDITQNPALEALKASYSGLTDLDYSQNPEIKHLWISDLKLPLPLDLSSLTKLEVLSAGKLGLTSIDLSKNINLVDVWVADNQLEEIDLSNNLQLFQVRVQNNKLKKLELKNHPAIYYVWMHDNQITEFNTTGMPELEAIDCSRNKIVELDFSSNRELRELYCSNNPMIYLNIQNDRVERDLIINDLLLKRVCCDAGDAATVLAAYPDVEIFTEPGSCPDTPISVEGVVSELSLVLAPNPTKGTLHVLGCSPEELKKLTVLDLSGMVLMSIDRPASSISIDALPAATYIVRLSLVGGSVASFKLVKE